MKITIKYLFSVVLAQKQLCCICLGYDMNRRTIVRLYLYTVFFL